MEETELHYLKSMSLAIRQDIIRMVAEAGSGHPGGSLSIADIVTVLFFDVMKHDPKDPCWVGRDRLILSKGHACPAVYAALAESGYFPKEVGLPSSGPSRYVQTPRSRSLHGKPWARPFHRFRHRSCPKNGWQIQ